MKKNPDYTLPNNLKVFFTPKSFDKTILAKPNKAVILKLICTFEDSHREDVAAEATFTSNDFTIINGRVKAGEESTKGVVTAKWTDFLGTEHQVDITIESTGTDELGQRFTSVDEAFGRSFAIVNEADGKALYGTTDQNLAYDVYEKAFADTNTGYKFKMETSTVTGCYLLRLMTPQNTEYSVWGGYAPGYLNGFSTVADCSFILGLNNQNGQDVKNGAVWDIQYVDGMGFTLLNKYTGKYLQDAASAKYDSPTYFSFCTLEALSGIDAPLQSAPSHQDKYIYNLQGVRMGTLEQWGSMPKGAYIVNGKLTVKSNF